MNRKIIDADHRSEMWDKADNARNEEAHLRDEVFELINALEYAYDELARIRCDYQADKQRFHDQARELARYQASLDWLKQRFEEEWTYEPGIGEVVDEIIYRFEGGGESDAG
ncbi:MULTISPECIES: helix-hairpin-helix domain-containing protein [Paenibacillus]|uniref:hypothetical protein n=1 Tax=Paenibacillus TaxID=44249 RepID=UPI0011A55E75|nr:hypothetical protein [Paenibacillus sp. IHBB 10380]